MHGACRATLPSPDHLVRFVGVAVTGLTDWSETGGKDSRVGLIHGVTNLFATSLFLASAIMRRKTRSRAALRASVAGYAVAMAGAYLGGALVYQRRLGTDHSADRDTPQEFTRTILASDLADGEKRKVTVGESEVVLVRQGEQVFALAERCAHQGGPLSEGEVRDGTIICPWHQSQYGLADGHVVHGPSTFDQPCYITGISGGFIEVKPRPT